MTKEQFKLVEQSYSHGDDTVISIGSRVFVCENSLKHKKEGTIEFQGCDEVDESCFEGREYYGEITKTHYDHVILADPYADECNTIATKYYQDEIVEIY